MKYRHRALQPPGSRARLIQKVYEIDLLKCARCGATMRIIAVIDDAGVIERILKHLSVWDPQPETHSPAGHATPRDISDFPRSSLAHLLP